MKSKLISIGNDIVVLDQTNINRTVQKRFYSKILSEDEVLLFNNNDFQLSFENFIWLCWSIKESVFKFVKRHHHDTVFSPTKIIVKTIAEPRQQTKLDSKNHEGISFQDEECFCCKALYNNHTYYTRSFVNNNFIFTVANNENCFKHVFWGVKSIDDDSYIFQSKLVRTLVLERLQKQCKNKHLQIKKAASGFPFITPHNNIPLSFTHHGNYVGYSFALEDKLN